MNVYEIVKLVASVVGILYFSRECNRRKLYKLWDRLAAWL